MFTQRALNLLNDQNIFLKIREVMVDYMEKHQSTPSIRSLVNMVEFVSHNDDCVCPYAWTLSVTKDSLLKLDLSVGVNISISFIFHKDHLVEYKVFMPDDVFDDVFIISGTDNIKSIKRFLEKSGIYNFIDSGKIKAREIDP